MLASALRMQLSRYRGVSGTEIRARCGGALWIVTGIEETPVIGTFLLSLQRAAPPFHAPGLQAVVRDRQSMG